MKRADLLSALSLIEPGLTDRGFLPILSCFCFDGKSIVAYDDVMAVKAPFKADFSGGIRGSVLMAILKASGVDEVSFTPGDTEMSVRLGKSKSNIKFPLLPPDDFVFEPPEEYMGDIPGCPEIIESINRCMISAGVNPSLPARLGLTIVVNSDDLTIYSSDEKTASVDHIPLKGVPKSLRGKIFTLPVKFFELWLKLDKTFGGHESISLGEVVEIKFSGASLFCKTILGSTVAQFSDVFESCLEDITAGVAIPKRFDKVLERSNILLSGQQSLEATFVVEGEILTVETTSTLGEAHETLSLKRDLGERSFKVSPVLIARALTFVDTIAFGENALVLNGGDFTHLVSIHPA